MKKYLQDNRENYKHWKYIHLQNVLNVDENMLELYEYEILNQNMDLLNHEFLILKN